MKVGHRGQRAENAGSSGALSSRTMMVTMTAKTASEYIARRFVLSLSPRITFLRSKYGDEPYQVQKSRCRWIRRSVPRGGLCERSSIALIARLPDLEPHVSESDSKTGRPLPSGRAGPARVRAVRSAVARDVQVHVRESGEGDRP